MKRLSDEEIREIIKQYRGRFGRLPEYCLEDTPRDRAIAQAQLDYCEQQLKEEGWVKIEPEEAEFIIDGIENDRSYIISDWEKIKAKLQPYIGL
jgi:hypothetical protein